MGDDWCLVEMEAENLSDSDKWKFAGEVIDEQGETRAIPAWRDDDAAALSELTWVVVDLRWQSKECRQQGSKMEINTYH